MEIPLLHVIKLVWETTDNKFCLSSAKNSNTKSGISWKLIELMRKNSLSHVMELNSEICDLMLKKVLKITRKTF